jgi:hypothetical protein
MSTSLTSAPLSSVDRQRMRANSDPSKQNGIHISTTPIDVSHLSAYSKYQTHSNSASPSNFDTPAELTSENSVFSEYDYAGDDEFFGVNFDAAEDQVIDADPLILAGTPLQPTELPTAEAYLPQLQADRAQSSETTTSSTYPMSSNQSSPPSRHSPKSETVMASQYELSKGLNAPQVTMPYNIQTMSDSAQGTFHRTGSGYTGGDNIGLGVAAHIGHSPRLTLTSWGSMEQQEIRTELDPADMQYSDHQSPWQDGIQDYHSSNQQYTISDNMRSPHTGTGNFGSGLDQQEAPDFDEESGRTGVDPERRKPLSEFEIPNFKEQEEAQRLRAKNMEVEEWRSQAGDSTDADDETPNQSSSTLNAPATSTRRRARTTSEIPGYFPPVVLMDTPRIKRDPTEGEGIDPVSDTESVRENQVKSGQVYFNPKATGIDARDRTLMQESRHWSDSPIYPYATDSVTQAPTAIEAAKKWNEAADTFSVLSRTATWGTRRRSEPSIADIESIHNGSFLKRLSFKTDKEFKTEREKRSNPLIDSITNMVRKKSDSSKLKRNRSANNSRGRPETGPVIKQEGRGNLAPPRGPISTHRRGASSPRLDTNLGSSPISGSSHGGSGSVSATASSPKTSLGFNIGAVIRRARSGSNLQHDPSKDGIYGMWKQTGGPPVAKLGATPFDIDPRPLDFGDTKGGDYSDAEGEDEEEEEPADDGEMMDFDQDTPIIPNFAGFQEHVIGLYPLIERTYLVDRIAHQQVVRYKSLLQWRVKHQGSIASNNCPAGHHCIALGGSPTLLEPKNQHRDSDASNTGAQALADVSDGDSNPEGALAAESFPPGVPMPPAQALPAEFECQLCFRVKKFQKPSDWTKHVHEDVQPFTCTYANCKEPKSFKRKADWVRHENERHRRLSWWTCTQDDCQHKCYRKDNFLQHLVREHKIPEPKQKTKAAAKKARNSDEAIWVLIRNCHHETSAKPQDEPCKFCGKVLNSWKKLTVHLAKHMELISLSVLRLVEQQPVSADTIISPVEPLQVRQAPLTPVDRTDRRPSNASIQYGNLSASISPHAHAMSQFPSPLYPQASPNIPDMSQFPGAVYNQNMGYNTTTAGQDISSYSVQAPIPHHQPAMMFDNNGMPYSHQMGPQMDNTQSRGFVAMDNSPSLEQTSNFTTVNGTYTPINQQQGYHSYPNSNSTLSPDPSSFASGPPQMPGFQAAQSLGPNQQSFATSPHHAPAQQPFASSPHQAPSYTSQQMPGFADENIYNNQVLQQTHNGLSYDQMGMGIRGQGGVGYPPTSTGGYPYHQQ